MDDTTLRRASEFLQLWNERSPISTNVHLTMGTDEYFVHERIIHGKSTTIDLLLENPTMVNGFKTITLEPYALTPASLETALLYQYIGTSALETGTSDAVQLLAVYNAAVKLNFSLLERDCVDKLGDCFEEILSDEVDELTEFMMAVSCVMSQEGHEWVNIRRRTQQKMLPQLSMLMQQEGFKMLLEQHPKFSLELLEAAGREIQRLTEHTNRWEAKYHQVLEKQEQQKQLKVNSAVEAVNAVEPNKDTKTQTDSSATLPEESTTSAINSDYSDTEDNEQWESCNEGCTAAVQRPRKVRAKAQFARSTTIPKRISRPVAVKSSVDQDHGPRPALVEPVLVVPDFAELPDPTRAAIHEPIETTHTPQSSSKSAPKDSFKPWLNQDSSHDISRWYDMPGSFQPSAGPQESSHASGGGNHVGNAPRNAVAGATTLDQQPARVDGTGRSVAQHAQAAQKPTKKLKSSILADGPPITCTPS